MWDEIEGDVVWSDAVLAVAVWDRSSPKSTNNQVVQAPSSSVGRATARKRHATVHGPRSHAATAHHGSSVQGSSPGACRGSSRRSTS